jgi:hypothetical protein
VLNQPGIRGCHSKVGRLEYKLNTSVQLPLSGEQLEVHFRLNTSHVDTPPLFKQSLHTGSEGLEDHVLALMLKST